MTSAKIITFLLGLLLLLPFFVTFSMMAWSGRSSEAELKDNYDKAMARMKQKVDAIDSPSSGTTFGAIRVIEKLTPHPRLSGIWILTPNRWVGVLGLVCCTLLMMLWGYSAFSTGTSFSEIYPAADYDPSADAQAVESGIKRLIGTNENPP